MFLEGITTTPKVCLFLSTSETSFASVEGIPTKETSSWTFTVGRNSTVLHVMRAKSSKNVNRYTYSKFEYR